MSSTLLHFDPGAGASGDMVLGALLDLGVPAEVVDTAVRAVGVDARLDVRVEARHGVQGKKVRFVDHHGEPVDVLETGGPVPPLTVPVHHHHDHDHHDHEPPHEDHHHHHPWPEIERRVRLSPLRTDVRDLALQILRRLAVAESEVHGIPLEDVALHEVAAVDSLGDMVGAAAALRHLEPARITCDSFGLCAGFIRMAHGVLPAPGPAAAALLKGAPVIGLDGRMETVTPTGAAILTTVADAYGPLPAMTLRAQGFGLGRKDPPERANLLRAYLGETGRKSERVPSPDVVQLETNLDDATPQQVARAAALCLKAGALDAWVTPILMKKGRPGWTLSALVDARHQEAVAGVLLRETPTSGVRALPALRTVAEREVVEVVTAHGPVRVKVARHSGEVLHVVPEADDCARLATRTGQPAAVLHALAVTGYHARVLPGGKRTKRPSRSARSSP